MHGTLFSGGAGGAGAMHGCAWVRCRNRHDARGAADAFVIELHNGLAVEAETCSMAEDVGAGFRDPVAISVRRQRHAGAEAGATAADRHPICVRA